MNPTITFAEEPTEWRMLETVRQMLEAAIGASYTYDASGAYITPRPQIKHLAEVEDDGGWPRAFYIVTPGDLSPQDYSLCATNFPGDFLVTGAVRVGGPELPWETGYVPAPQVQLRIVRDIFKTLHLKEVEGATLKVANRNLDIEVDGWAIVQVQVSFEYSEVDE